MTHIKPYQIFENSHHQQYTDFPKTEEEINKLCNKYNIKDYVINSDLSIDVNEDVRISDLGLRFIPLKFNHVKGNFFCNTNRLESLEGSPSKVSGTFTCHDNQLETLVGSPDIVEGEFICDTNLLTNLKGSPKKVLRNFYCVDNILSSTQGMPKYIGGDFNCSDNQLSSFSISGVIKGDIDLYSNMIKIIIGDFINDSNRDMLIKEFNHYNIVDGDEVYKDRLEMFISDYDLEEKINIDEIKVFYEIIE